MLFFLHHWKLIVPVLSVLAAAGLIWGYGHSQYNAGKDQCASEYQQALHAFYERADLDIRKTELRYETLIQSIQEEDSASSLAGPLVHRAIDSLPDGSAR